MADQDLSEYAPNEHYYNHTECCEGQARQDPVNQQSGDKYQACAEQHSCQAYHYSHRRSHPGTNGAGVTARIFELKVEAFGGADGCDDQIIASGYQYVQSGQQLTDGGVMAAGHHQIDHLHGDSAPYQPRDIGARFDGTWDQDRHGEGSSWPRTGQQQHCLHDCSNQSFDPGLQPLNSQASRSSDFMDPEKLMDTSCCTGDGIAMAQATVSSQYEQTSRILAQDDGITSEPSIDMEAVLAEYQAFRRHVENPGWYSHQNALEEAQPWNPLAVIDHSQPPDFHLGGRPFGDVEVSTTELLTETSQDATSSYVMVNNPSSASSLPEVAENIADSTATLRQPDSHSVVYEFPVVYSDPSGMASMLDQQVSARSQPILNLTNLNILSQAPDRDHLFPSSPGNASIATSTSSRRSVPNIIHCPELDCGTEFTGKFRQGNYARHRRNQHKGPVVVACESPGCPRVFKRTDARQKHYRKYHPELASKLVPRPKIFDQEFELSRVGSGLE